MAKIVVLGTGGTIAGTADSAHQSLGYAAARLGIEELVARVPALSEVDLVCEQVAQIDSKDMEHEVWRALALRCGHWLQDPGLQGLVITHGTDTLEETAFFLHQVLAARRPVVMTCAMRPATALLADGPQNLFDAVAVARTGGAHGVVAVCAGQVHAATDVSKQHTWRLDAFSSGEAGPVAVVEDGEVRPLRAWPQPVAAAPALLQALAGPVHWPRVEIVTSHAGASGAVVDALLAQGVDGIVVAAAGNGSVHRRLEAALQRAEAAGVKVVRATRCTFGRVLGQPDDALAHAGALSPVKARVALMLQLLAQQLRA